MDLLWLTAFVDRPASGVAAATEFWQRVTGSSLSTARGERGQFATFLPADGDAYLRVQTVLDGTGGTHLDLHVPDVESAARQAVALGAQVRPRGGSATLTSPAGLLCCLVPEESARLRRPSPVSRDGGHTSLVDQVCIDVPPDGFERECDFWQALTGWPLRPTSRPEFAYLTRPAGVPLRLLLQRLDSPGARGRAGCHLDVACSDLAAEVALHRSWGAEERARLPWWSTLADPSGIRYCITSRHPTTDDLPS